MTTSTASRASLPRVALETTLLLHGVSRHEALPLHRRLEETIRNNGAEPALVGVVDGHARTDLSEDDLQQLINTEASMPPKAPASGSAGTHPPDATHLAASSSVPKLNTANLGARMFRGGHGATTVSTTMELAAKEGVAVFATGGLGGVHFPSPTGKSEADRGYPSHRRDVSADLIALTRFPVVVVCSGVKSILDVAATREVLETLGVPVIGFRTDEFPCFYLRRHPSESINACDARFDDAAELSTFARFELARTNRAILVCNPIPVEHELPADLWQQWLSLAQARVVRSVDAAGRNATPAVLAELHNCSGGRTLAANIELVVDNAALASRIAVGMGR